MSSIDVNYENINTYSFFYLIDLSSLSKNTIFPALCTMCSPNSSTSVGSTFSNKYGWLQVFLSYINKLWKILDFPLSLRRTPFYFNNWTYNPTYMSVSPTFTLISILSGNYVLRSFLALLNRKGLKILCNCCTILRFWSLFSWVPEKSNHSPKSD